MQYETLEVRKVTGGCGAEILGLNLANDLSNRQWDELRHVFFDHGVIFFRNQAEHVFGENSKHNNPERPKRNAYLAVGEVSHPVAITHPESGKKALYVNPGFTLRFEGWTAQESKPLLDYLYAHAVRPEFGCRFRWRPGSIAFWDNRSTWHYAANDYHGEKREMHRITIAGSRLS